MPYTFRAEKLQAPLTLLPALTFIMLPWHAIDPSPDSLETDVDGQLNHAGNSSAMLLHGSVEGSFRVTRNARRKMTARHLCQTYPVECA